jgi:hypothetical protein
MRTFATWIVSMSLFTGTAQQGPSADPCELDIRITAFLEEARRSLEEIDPVADMALARVNYAWMDSLAYALDRDVPRVKDNSTAWAVSNYTTSLVLAEHFRSSGQHFRSSGPEVADHYQTMSILQFVQAISNAPPGDHRHRLQELSGMAHRAMRTCSMSRMVRLRVKMLDKVAELQGIMVAR